MSLSKSAEFSSTRPVEGKPTESPPHTLFLTSGIQVTVSEQMPFPRQAIVKFKIASRLMVYSSTGNISLEVTKGDFLLTNLPKNNFLLTRSRTGLNQTEKGLPVNLG